MLHCSFLDQPSAWLCMLSWALQFTSQICTVLKAMQQSMMTSISFVDLNIVSNITTNDTDENWESCHFKPQTLVAMPNAHRVDFLSQTLMKRSSQTKHVSSWTYIRAYRSKAWVLSTGQNWLSWRFSQLWPTTNDSWKTESLHRYIGAFFFNPLQVQGTF